MKKLCSTIMLLAMMVAALGLPSCSSDDSDGESINPFVGLWQEETTNAYCHFIVFASDGKGFAGDWDRGDSYENIETFSYENKETFGYTYTESEISIYKDNTLTEVYQYTRYGRVLHLTKDGNTTVYMKIN